MSKWHTFSFVSFTAFVLFSLSTPAQNLVLWNGLGSVSEVENSFEGPNLSFFSSPSGIDLPANPDFVPGRYGQGLIIGAGSYQTFRRYHNVVVNNLPTLIDADRGTVEMWVKQLDHPVEFQHNPHRLFDGSYGLGSGMSLQIADDQMGGSRIIFALAFGATTSTHAISLTDGLPGHDVSSHLGQWMHVRATWDRTGIPGANATMQLRIDGALVAISQLSSWGATVGPAADIGGANDAGAAGRFVVDELRIWDGARGPQAGSGEDFVLVSTVNGGGTPEATIKSIFAGDQLQLGFGTPNGHFVGALPILLGQVFLTGSFVPTSATFPSVLVTTGQAVVVFNGASPASPFGPWLLGPSFMNGQFEVPPGLAGLTVRFQALAAAPWAANTFFAASDAHDIQVY